MAPRRYDSEFSGTSGNRVHDDGSLPAFPVFDSLPSTAGLSNTEAFRLSLKHALTLLPRMLEARRDAAADEAEAERFSLR